MGTDKTCTRAARPFYLYAYAFGECMATSLFALCQAAPDGFAARYRTLLAGGGTAPQEDAPAGFVHTPTAAVT